MTLEELIKEKTDRLQNIPDEFLSATEKSQKGIFTELLTLLNQLTVKDGKFEVTEENLRTVQQITQDLKEVVLGSDYVKAVSDFAKEFDGLKDINDKYFNAAFPDFAPSDVTEQILKNSKRLVVTDLISSSLDSEFLLPIEQLLNDAVSANAGYRETLKQIRTFVEGGDNAAGEQIDGKILKYSKVLAHDSFAVSDASYTNAVSNELGLEWYYIDGIELAASRCFCIERKGNFYHYKEIEGWAVGIDVGECGYPWAGFREGTTPDTIFNFRGGWGCIDAYQPVSIVIVPKEDVLRNMENGNFIPSDFERKELGL